MTISLPTAVALDAPVIAVPCPAAWDEMRGDDRARFCGQCRKHVYDLTGMTNAEVIRLLRDTNETPCIRFFKRADGKMMTADCPVGLRMRMWRRLRRRGAWVASAFAAAFLPSCKTATQGVCPESYGEAMAIVNRDRETNGSKLDAEFNSASDARTAPQESAPAVPAGRRQ